MDSLLQDIRYALRMLINNPGLTFVALIALALGIGANTAIFSVVNATLLRPLPFRSPEQLALVWGDKKQKDWPQLPLSFPNFKDVREQSHVFQDMGAWVLGRFNLSGVDQPERVQYAIVTASFFPVLDIKPILGRTFLSTEDQPGAARVAILSYSLWQRRLGADSDLVGKTLTLD